MPRDGEGVRLVGGRGCGGLVLEHDLSGETSGAARVPGEGEDVVTSLYDAV